MCQFHYCDNFRGRQLKGIDLFIVCEPSMSFQSTRGNILQIVGIMLLVTVIHRADKALHYHRFCIFLKALLNLDNHTTAVDIGSYGATAAEMTDGTSKNVRWHSKSANLLGHMWKIRTRARWRHAVNATTHPFTIIVS